LNAAAAAHLVGIEEKQSLVSGNLAKTRVVLANVNKAAADSQAALDAALQTGNVQFIRAQAGVTAYVVSLRELAVANVQAAIAENEEAAAASKSAAAHAQAAKGVTAQSLSFAGLRAGTLAASRGFLLGTAATLVFAKSIKEASSETEELNKTAVVFGQSAKQIEEFSKTTAESLGISSTEALKSAGIFGNLFRTIKISEPVAADMSETMVRLASDLASFNNASPERTLEAIRAGLVGQSRPLRAFGIFLSAARVQQEALVQTGKSSVKQLTEAEKVQARYALILRDSNLAQGDFVRTSDRLANQSRILKAQITNLSVSLGNALVPGLTNTVSATNNLIRIFQDVTKIASDAANSNKALSDSADTGRLSSFRKSLADLLTPGKELKIVTKGLADGLDFLAGRTEETTKAMSGFHFAIGGLPAEMAAITAAANKVNLSNITQQLNALEVERLKIQTGLAPGDRAGEEENLRRQIADDKKAVEQSQSGTAARKDALEKLKSDQDELASLLKQDAADATDRAQKIKDAASAQKDAANKAAQAQEDATQAFIDQFSGKQQRLQNRLTNAQLFGNALQQIAINKQIVAADRAEINAIKDRIKHLRLHGDALKIAQAAIKALNQEIFNTRNAIAQLQAERKQAAVDARQAHLEAMLSIAETTASTRDDVAAQRALIRFDNAQIKRLLALKKRRRLTQDEAAQLDAYRVDLAQRNAALKKTTEEQKKGADTAKAQFEFLQRQAGFAANLLGNLIPGSATGGLLGGTTGTGTGTQNTGTGSNIFPAAISPFEHGRGRGPAANLAAQSATTPAGPSRTGQARQTYLLTQINQVLHNIYRGTGHPEAHYRRRTNISRMDIAGG
jgi:hypothetical protein